jgi:MoaA/NifB/PqqE/SkfB family radical SAM enzyme
MKKYILGRPSPLAMTFAVTYRCQCACPHCSAGRFLRPMAQELSTEEAKRVIDESLDLGICILAFTGGEPMLRSDIFELVSRVDHRKAMPIMFTNGSLLSKENVDRLVDAGIYTVFLSLDAASAEEHDRLRGIPGLFDTAVEGLARLKSRGVMVAISTYASRTGTDRGAYRRMYGLAESLGVHSMLLFDNVATGKQLDHTDETLRDDQREEILAFTRDIFDRAAVPSLSSQVWQNSLEGYLSGIGCLAGNLQYYVGAYGDVSPCDFTPLGLGNVREESLKDIWKRLTEHPAYRHSSHICRMQHHRFRSAYIDPIPSDAPLPFPIDKLPRIDYRSPRGAPVRRLKKDLHAVR